MRKFESIYEIVRQIPSGSVMTYGQVAAEAGTNARSVAWALASSTDSTLPWYRVVGAGGVLVIGKRSVDLMAKQEDLLRGEGVVCVDGRVSSFTS